MSQPQQISDIISNVTGVLKQRMEEMRAKGIIDLGQQEQTIKCDWCNDQGFVLYDVPMGHPLWNKPKACPHCEKGQESLRRSWSNRIKTAGLPPKYQTMTFDGWNNLPENMKKGKYMAAMLSWLIAISDKHYVSLRNAYDACKVKYPYSFDIQRNSLVLQGPHGYGKTGLAASVVNHLNYNAITPALYIRVDDFFSEIRKSVQDQKRSESNGSNFEGSTMDDLTTFLSEAPFLVLDEFYMAQITDSNFTRMESIIRYRHSRQLPTIITCNQTPKELELVWGKATMDVIEEMAFWQPLGGEKLRVTLPPLAAI